MAAYLTADQLAARWQCSGSYVRRLCREGQLSTFRLGSEWRIPEAAVTDYERRHSQPATTAPATNDVAPRQSVSHLSALPHLPADYEPAFPELWPDHVARPATRRGGSTGTKKAGCQR